MVIHDNLRSSGSTTLDVANLRVGGVMESEEGSLEESLTGLARAQRIIADSDSSCSDWHVNPEQFRRGSDHSRSSLPWAKPVQRARNRNDDGSSITLAGKA